jgi:mannosyltransferase OCH1-like enzyme
MIPKIIWQTYESEYKDLPPLALECANSWQEKNPDWEYRYVSGKERAEFVLKNFDEEWLTIYKSYKTGVSRSILWKYMALYVYGGLYSDIDILCKKPIDAWFNLNKNFFASEDPKGPGYSDMFFVSSSNNIFLKNILNNIKNKYYEKNIYSNIIDYTTNEVGYVIFTNSIQQTIFSKEVDPNSFLLYTDKDAEKLHNELINHYRAGRKEKVFGPNYIAWQTEEYK